MEETLLIGIGAQKAGTTWLADYLRTSQPLVHVPPVKEVHFFDSYCLPTFGKFFEEQRLAAFKARVNGLTLDSVGGSQENEILLAHLYRFRATRSPEAYLRFLNWGRGKQPILSDITPDYALLDKAGFDYMRAAHPNIKLVFILRNPADRFWSSLRFNHTHNPQFDIEGNFDRMIAREDFVRFANYDRTIRLVEEVFGTENLHLIFYEDLFSDAAMQKFCAWLGLPFMQGDYGTKSNAAVSGAMSEVRRRQAVLTYQQTYREISARFGTALPPSWQQDISAYL